MSEKQNLFVPPGHFYSPIVESHEARLHIQKLRAKDGPILGIELDDALMKRNFNALSKASADIPFFDNKEETYRYYYVNDQFSYGDACIYYAYLKTLKPKKVVEIGSGYSSALALDVCELFDHKIELTFIEPYPDRINRLLRDKDKAHVTLIEDKVQNVDFSVFEQLVKNDILFIDSSHVAKTGSDVCFEIFEIIPRLKPGVRVIIHDMFYPFEYPETWAVDQGRSWNELYLVRALLMNNSKISIDFFNHYFALKFSEIALKKILYS